MSVGHLVGWSVIALGQLDEANDEVLDLPVGARAQVRAHVCVRQQINEGLYHMHAIGDRGPVIRQRKQR